ncbi:MAG: DegT/DnrJ/EryC1/StrS family aminotransferase [Actinobacteria bacterium]|nr:DegT/DnrJ/EryC1/StrS family aminotransferase [Actinomycetota bacterium]
MTIVPINDLSRWDNSERDRIDGRIQAVVKSGHFMLGSNTKELESQLSRRLDGMNVMCVGNGTDALAVSILGLGLKAGDKIATVANAGGYATGAILRLGCIPILIDVDPDTTQMAPISLSAAIVQHPDIKAVIVTHLYGLMADITAISTITKEKKILLIEDCAQAIGASTDRREAGSWGDASTFSFYPTKNLGCLGDGGAVAFRDAVHYASGRRVAQYGWSERYVISDMNGFNSRLDEIQASVLLERIQTLQSNNDKRRAIVRQYADALPASHKMIWRDDASYVGHLAIVVGPSRAHIQQVLDAHEVGHGIHYPLTDNSQPAWQEVFVDASVPNCDQLATQIVTIPCFPSMTDAEIAQVCTALAAL